MPGQGNCGPFQFSFLRYDRPPCSIDQAALPRLMSRIKGVILSRVVNQVFKRTVTQHSSKCRFRLHPFSAIAFFVQTGNSTFDDLHMRTKSRGTAIHVLQISPPSAIILVARRTSRERAKTLLISLLGIVYQRLWLISAQVSSRRP